MIAFDDVLARLDELGALLVEERELLAAHLGQRHGDRGPKSADADQEDVEAEVRRGDEIQLAPVVDHRKRIQDRP